MHGPRCLFAAPWGLQDTPNILEGSISLPAGCHQKLKVFGVCMARIMLKPNTPQTMLDCICVYVCSCVCEVLFQPHTHTPRGKGGVGQIQCRSGPTDGIRGHRGLKHELPLPLPYQPQTQKAYPKHKQKSTHTKSKPLQSEEAQTTSSIRPPHKACCDA